MDRRGRSRIPDGGVLAVVAAVLGAAAAARAERELRLAAATTVVLGIAAVAGLNPSTPVPHGLRRANLAALVVALFFVGFGTIGNGLTCESPCVTWWRSQAVMCGGCLAASFAYLFALRRGARESYAFGAAAAVLPVTASSVAAGMVLV